jgi:DNA-binding CsgD family transcriptional regulator
VLRPSGFSWSFSTVVEEVIPAVRQLGPGLGTHQGYGCVEVRVLGNVPRQLLDRDAELAQITARMEEARSGVGGLLAIEGPAGIGKTRLLEAASELASKSDMGILQARGSELERDFPFGVVRQLFERRVADSRPADERKLLAGAAGLAAPVLGLDAVVDSGRETLTAADPAFAALHGLYWLLVNVASERPLVLLVDDAHWADTASLRFLAYLVPRLTELPALVIAASRADEPASKRDLLERIRSDPVTRNVRPGPLGGEAVTAIARERLGTEPHEAFVEACRVATSGNPFLLKELLSALEEDGCSGSASDAEAVSGLGPRNVARSVALRLGRLLGGARGLAEAIAVLGERAELRHAAAMAGLNADVAQTTADALRAAGVLAPGRPLEFAHPIVRASIHSSIPSGQRSLAHAKAAELLQRDAAEPEAVAAHLLAVDPRADESTAETLISAGESAFWRGAPELAVRYLERALDEPPSENRRSVAMFTLGRAEASSGDPAATAHLRTALELSEDPASRAQIAIELTAALVVADREREAVEMLEGVVAQLQQHPDLALRVESELLTAAQLDPETIPIAEKRMMALAQTVLQERPEGDSLGERLILANLSFGAAASAVAPSQAVIDIARRAVESEELPDENTWITMGLGLLALAYADAFDTSLERFEAAKDEARRSGAGLLYGLACCWRSNVAYRAGQLQEAEADARAAIEMGLSDWGEVGCEVAFLVDVLLERGELDEAEEALAHRELLAELPQLVHTNFIIESRGRLRVAQRRPEEGLEELLQCGRNLEAAGARNPALAAWRSRAALVHAQLGDSDEARRLAGEEVELARAFGAPRALGMSLRALGLVSEGEVALTLLGEAVEVLEESGAALERARALADFGAALRRDGQRREARDPLRRALDEARRCGAPVLAEHAENELRATGARPRRLVLSGVDALTASERRIADMAAGGLSNKEIAQALFLTVRTVEMHLTGTYRKLDIRSRSELAGALGAAAPGERETPTGSEG